MALTAGQKTKVRQVLHQAYSARNRAIPWTKADVDTAIGEADTWQNSAKTSFNNALSNPFKTSASSGDKALLLSVVVAADYLLADPAKAAVLRDVMNAILEITGVE